MTRVDILDAVLGGANLAFGLSNLTESIRDDSAWGAVGGCIQLALGAMLVTSAYAARRNAATELEDLREGQR